MIAAWDIAYCVPFVTPIATLLWGEVRAAGSADDGGAGAGVAVESRADADRRCGQAGEVVLRAEAARLTGEG